MKIRQIGNIPLLEASFKFYRHNTSCARFTITAGSMPNLAIISEKPLKETDKITILLISTTKINQFYKSVYGKDRESKEYKNWLRIVSALTSPDSIGISKDVFSEFPQFFKMADVSGRERIFRYLTTDLKMPEGLYEKIFGEKPLEKLDDKHTERFHNALLMFPETMRDNRKENFLPVLELVYEHLKTAGLVRVFGGNIRVIASNGKRIGAYMINTRDMMISSQLTNENTGAVYTLIHEYGHKHFYEFLTNAEREEVKEKFASLIKSGKRLLAAAKHKKDDVEKQASANDAVDLSLLVPGQVVIYTGRSSIHRKNGQRYLITRYDERAGDLKLAREDDPRRTISGPPAAFNQKPWQFYGSVGDKKDVKKPASVTGGKYHRESDSWFPTSYSLTEYEEWYAECFAFYVLGHLHGEPKEWFSAIIK